MPSASVRVWRDTVTLPTYEPHPPQRCPMFLENRVYQGSSGRVYPLPVTERIAEAPVPRAWAAVHLENEYLRLLVLPELGGRLHVAQDRTSGYDLVYRQEVIKPALVGLAGPWVSGGIEFNWPQHHRPSTFLPCDVAVEEEPDGSKTVWLSEHDPLQRMKGMHGICLHPGRAVIELRVRVYNRTPLPQTFLWWANVATRVHEGYQSFLPPDVAAVADHARRAISAYPRATGRYYGINYGRRVRDGVPPAEVPARFVPSHLRPATPRDGGGAAAAPAYAANDLRWYANIPVPTSYMVTRSEGDFFGGYDHRARVGLVHVANHHLAPGKKQWTWGNHEFGYAWDRNLTEPGPDGNPAPYIELMAGVYTDNQPDFAFLQPGETKAWSQFWYPIRAIGPACHANVESALSLAVTAREGRIGVAVTRVQNGAQVRVGAGARQVYQCRVDLDPARPHLATFRLPPRARAEDLLVTVQNAGGRELLRYCLRPSRGRPAPTPASEPPAPAAIASADELYVTGLHLEQYRHATRRPEIYWQEAVRRDPGDARCRHALGLWHLRRGEFRAAVRHVRAALARLTCRNANPYDGEPFYTLGLVLRHQGRDEDAYAAFYKATWNQAWQAAGYHALAEIDCTREDWATALDHLDRALRLNADHLRARDLRAMVLRRLGREAEAGAAIEATLELDPLDWWARYLRGDALGCDTPTRLDLVHDLARAGFRREALALLEETWARPSPGTAPLVSYTAAWLAERLGETSARRGWLQRARKASPDYCFPARLEELRLLEWAVALDPADARAACYLGNLLYDRRRHDEALRCWERAARGLPHDALVWRNLGLGYYNARRSPARAIRAYDRACRESPEDARLLFERDQLWKRVGRPVAARLAELVKRLSLVRGRDDLAVEYGALLVQAGRPADALAWMTSRRFQPWEGGEGLARGVFVRAHLALGRQALAAGEPAAARRHFAAALTSPENLGEARHLLANCGDVHYWLGCAHAAGGEREAARAAWTAAGELKGDLQDKRLAVYSDKTYYTALAWEQLGRRRAARQLLRTLLAHARRLPGEKAELDYFATSLPSMMLFDDDLRARQATTAKYLEGLARLGLGERAAGRRALRTVLRRDPSHAGARDHLAVE